MPATARTRPPVSVVMTVLNERRHLRQAVRCILAQRYDGDLEVVIAVGRSTDGTEALAHDIAREHPAVCVVPNPSPRGATPAGLNAAIAASRRDVVVRVDGHAMLPPDYVEIAVQALEATGADNVGGVMAAEGESPFEQAVARAMTTRLGVGNAPFHTGGSPGPADSVYLGVFRRSALLRVGGYDETFERAQDWELNYRIRTTGGTVWFEPRLRVSYRPRSSLRGLARQYFHYGRWRRALLRRDPGTASFRYLAPPVALLGVSTGVVTGVAGFRPAFTLPAGYLAVIGSGAAANARGLSAAAALRLPGVYATMHMAWAAGFLTSPADLAAGARPLPTTTRRAPSAQPEPGAG
ncbi:MAG: glycosyltransferase family 2 protein [Actinomycetota bacterium]|nr:glycosyltransferase family 2 protein [Actinomycetota bacterium]